MSIPLCRAIVIAPAEPHEPGCLGSCDVAFPFRTEGRLPQLAFSRLIRRSLRVTARTLAERLAPPFSSKALDRSLPPDRLRLLPGGPTALQDGSRTHGTNTTFPRRTPDAQVLKLRDSIACLEMQAFHAQTCAWRAAQRKRAVVAAEGSHGTLTPCRSPGFR